MCRIIVLSLFFSFVVTACFSSLILERKTFSNRCDRYSVYLLLRYVCWPLVSLSSLFDTPATHPMPIVCLFLLFSSFYSIPIIIIFYCYCCFIFMFYLVSIGMLRGKRVELLQRSFYRESRPCSTQESVPFIFCIAASIFFCNYFNFLKCHLTFFKRMLFSKWSTSRLCPSTSFNYHFSL
uniref:Uncharacterized protein TCIL3000_11_6260 n=1 Tax=Trypanosoma congolense (strain IL3000) TaxID=1068625 RepID=G0V0N2_TRYCI|nr:unnamed protein product [Trypanosoma congolense IL3000]